MTSRISVLLQRAALVAASLMLIAAPISVNAHAALDVATPADGAMVTGTPPEISGTYVQDLADGSSFKLRDAAGTLVAEGIIDPDDDRRMFIPVIPDLGPGEYTVRSTTVSGEDGETDRASWTFTVEAAPSPTPAPTLGPTATPADSQAPTLPSSETPTPDPSPSPAPSPTPSGGDNVTAGGGGDILLPIIAAVALLAVGATWFARRGRATPRP